MTVNAMDVRHENGAGLPSLGLDRATRDGLAAYARLTWPSGTVKAAAREWDLSIDAAKGLVAGRASLTTIDWVWKHPRGGWAVIFPVLGAVVGHGAEVFLQSQRTKHAELARRHGALVRDLRARPAVPHHRADQLAADPGRKRDARGG